MQVVGFEKKCFVVVVLVFEVFGVNLSPVNPSYEVYHKFCLVPDKQCSLDELFNQPPRQYLEGNQR